MEKPDNKKAILQLKELVGKTIEKAEENHNYGIVLYFTDGTYANIEGGWEGSVQLNVL